MASQLPHQLHTSIDKRVLNEFGSKILNEERKEQVKNIRERSSVRTAFVDTSFHCECDDEACMETISMSTEMYEKVHQKTKQFIVVPSHVRLDIEDVGARLPSYVVVEKHFPHTKKLSL